MPEAKGFDSTASESTEGARAVAGGKSLLTRARSLLVAASHRPEAGALVGTIGVFAFFTVAAGGVFLTGPATASWANVAAELGIIAVPVGLLMISGELDLSVGSVVGASSMVVAIWSGYYHLPIAGGICLALLMGAFVGLFNGVVTTRTRLPSFIVTLGSSFAVSGATLGVSTVLTGTTSVAMTSPASAVRLFAWRWDNFNVAIVWWIGLALIGAWILHETRYGNWVFAIGGDQDTARSAGVRVVRVKISLFIASGLGAALVGVIQAVEFNGGQVANGSSFLFNSIIAVVIGGVLLTGGYGSIFGVVLGTITFAIVNQGIYYTGWDSNWASVFLGGLLLAAVLANNSFRRMAVSQSTRAQRKA